MLQKAVAIKTIYDFSFIVTTRNNPKELQRTLSSIISEAPDDCEIIIVDGSDNPKGKNFYLNVLETKKIKLNYLNDNKKGIYNAMNLGVENSLGNWLIMLTAGDYLKFGSKELFKIILNSCSDVIVFSQDVEGYNGRINFSFYPTVRTVWPHQSVVIKRVIHERIGLYPIDKKYKYSSEQFLFLEIRKSVKFEIRNEIFSVFCLGGLSSTTSLSKSYESFRGKVAHGQGVITSFFQAYIFTNIRYFLEKNILFERFSVFLRIRMYSYYKQPNKETSN